MRFSLFSCFLIILLLTSCSKKDEIEKVVLPNDTALTDSMQYAVVIEPYVSFRDKPSDDGITSSHARSGEIFEVEAIKAEMKNGKQILWINLKNAGWLTSSSVRLYPTKEKASTASKKLK
ncbi:MAG: hypothetical protein ACTTJ3_03365 [Treponema sp.]